jgi:hypothetical protein
MIVMGMVTSLLQYLRRMRMLWLIWIAMMLVVPALAGVKVWFDIRRDQSDS